MRPAWFAIVAALTVQGACAARVSPIVSVSSGSVFPEGVQADVGQPEVARSGAVAQPAGAILAEVNRERAANGLPALSLDARLGQAAESHAAAMLTGDFFDHASPDGASVADRVRAAGYAWGVVAENIAAGQPTPAKTVQSWMHSPGHRRNILKPDVRHIGVGYAHAGQDGGQVDYHHYWVLVLAAPLGR